MLIGETNEGPIPKFHYSESLLKSIHLILCHCKWYCKVVIVNGANGIINSDIESYDNLRTYYN